MPLPCLSLDATFDNLIIDSGGPDYKMGKKACYWKVNEFNPGNCTKMHWRKNESALNDRMPTVGYKCNGDWVRQATTWGIALLAGGSDGLERLGAGVSHGHARHFLAAQGRFYGAYAHRQQQRPR